MCCLLDCLPLRLERCREAKAEYGGGGKQAGGLTHLLLGHPTFSSLGEMRVKGRANRNHFDMLGEWGPCGTPRMRLHCYPQC